MGKIDVSGIEGYADMSAEQKVAALEAFEYEDNASALEEANKKIKGLEGKGALYDKVASELASLKKANRDKLSEDEKAKLASEERDKELAELKASIAKRDAIDNAISAYGKYGMDRDTAEKFIESGDSKIITDLMDKYAQSKVDAVQNGQHDPHAGHNGNGNGNNYPKPTRAVNSTVDMKALEKFYK